MTLTYHQRVGRFLQMVQRMCLSHTRRCARQPHGKFTNSGVVTGESDHGYSCVLCVSVSQFGAKPVLCEVVANCAPGLTRARVATEIDAEASVLTAPIDDVSAGLALLVTWCALLTIALT